MIRITVGISVAWLKFLPKLRHALGATDIANWSLPYSSDKFQLPREPIFSREGLHNPCFRES
jgi:hypothetical protein